MEQSDVSPEFIEKHSRFIANALDMQCITYLIRYVF